MSVVKIQIPPSFGRVSRLTESKSQAWVTLECFDVSRAYRFPVPIDAGISIGDWMTVSGIAKMERISKSGSTDSDSFRLPTYYHVPHGLASGEGWTFFEVSDPVWEMIGQDYVNKVAREVREAFPTMDAELAATGRISRTTVDETIVVVQKLLYSLKAYREAKSPEDMPPLKAVDLEL